MDKDELETLKHEIRMRGERARGVDRPHMSHMTSDILVIGVGGTLRPDSEVLLGGEEELGG